MCGIYGMVSFRGPLRSSAALEAMGRAIRHRGPDDHLLIIEPDAALGTERLRITDLRPEGAQPFTDPTSRVWLSCNGAIYNADQLRARYSSYPFRSSSDVETLLPLYLDAGAEGFTEIDGMFAVAVWDGRARCLILARDRAGEKPLFYARLEDELWFASEVQALLEPPSIGRTLDDVALHDYLRLGYPRAPRTMFAGVRTVEPGTVLTFAEQETKRSRYWKPEDIPVEPVPTHIAADRLDSLLVRAVEKQLQADVPVGVFTSGGVDSALLAVLASRVGGRGRDTLRTFTVGFPSASYDERRHAERLADHVGSSHLTVCADDEALMGALDVIADRVAEPVADPAILPTYLLAEAAREHVGVVLSGEGADELLGGYPTYVGHLLTEPFMRLPRMVRSGIGSLVKRLPTSHSKVPVEFLLKRFVAHAGSPAHERHLAWFGTGLPADLAGTNASGGGSGWPTVTGTDVARQAMLFDYRTYLPEGLLTKVDRATMLVALEARAPYLDRDLTAFALTLPTNVKVSRTTTKWLLKRVAERHVPRAIVRRRKRGLSVPIGSWINGGLRAEVDRMLHPERLRAAGLLNASIVSRLLLEHRSGRANHARALWALLVLERWRDRWIENRQSGRTP